MKGAEHMSTDTVNLSIRMERDLKEQAEHLFSELGMNMTTALNIFELKTNFIIFTFLIFL